MLQRLNFDKIVLQIRIFLDLEDQILESYFQTHFTTKSDWKKNTKYYLFYSRFLITDINQINFFDSECMKKEYSSRNVFGPLWHYLYIMIYSYFTKKSLKANLNKKLWHENWNIVHKYKLLKLRYAVQRLFISNSAKSFQTLPSNMKIYDDS